MIGSLKEAIPIACNLVEKRCQDKIANVRLVNRNRHCIITTKRNLKYWILYKNQFFLSFGKIFGFSGCGDSINANMLCKALNQKIDGFIFIYRKGDVYFVSPREILDFGRKFGTIRETKSHERTYSFPLLCHKRWR